MAVVVNKQQGESKNELINRFRKLFSEEGIMDIIRKKVRYIKPARRRYERKKEISHRVRLEKHQRNR